METELVAEDLNSNMLFCSFYSGASCPSRRCLSLRDESVWCPACGCHSDGSGRCLGNLHLAGYT